MDKDNIFIACMFIAAILICVGIWIGHSYLEASAYNNITGKKVSTFDAMFVELRVQEPASD